MFFWHVSVNFAARDWVLLSEWSMSSDCIFLNAVWKSKSSAGRLRAFGVLGDGWPFGIAAMGKTWPATFAMG